MIDCVKLDKRSDAYAIFKCMNNMVKDTDKIKFVMRYIHYNKEEHRFEACQNGYSLLVYKPKDEQLKMLEEQIHENTLFNFDKSGMLLGVDIKNEYPDVSRVIPNQSGKREFKLFCNSSHKDKKGAMQSKYAYMDMIYTACVESKSCLNPRYIATVNDIRKLFTKCYITVNSEGINELKPIVYVDDTDTLTFVALPYNLQFRIEQE